MVRKARFLATQARDDAPHYQHSELGYNYRMSNIVAGIGRGQMRVVDERVNQRRLNHDYYFKELGETWFGAPMERITKSSDGHDGTQKPGSFLTHGFHESGTSSSSSSSSSYGIYFLKEPKGYKSNRWLTTILVNPTETDGVTREDIRMALEEVNIECRPLWKPMHLQPLYREFPFYSQEGFESEGRGGISGWLFEYGLCLPSGSNMSEADRIRVVNAMRNLLKPGSA